MVAGRRTGIIIALTAAGALMMLAILFIRRPFALAGFSFQHNQLRELANALIREAARPAEGRLSAGFAYAPWAPPTRGVEERRVSSAILSAAARLEDWAEQTDRADAHAALGLGHLASRRWDRAIESLNEALYQDPGNANTLIDLSAAYLARASADGAADDWVQGLAAASRAIAIAPRRPEAFFNRAIALERLHLTQAAADAWTAYQRIDADTGWTAEAARRARALATRGRERASESDARSDRQPLRERIENVLLSEWGRAVAAGDATTAAARLDEAERLAGELSRAGGDAMARDAIGLIRQAQARGASSAVRTLARGHVLYGQARAAYLADKQGEAAELMSKAAREFRAAGSPYAWWEHIFRAIALRTEGWIDRSTAALAKIDPDLPSHYVHLRSRHAWAYGVARDEEGRFDLGVQALSRAVDGFRASGERGHLARTLAILAEAEWSLGDHRAAWTHVLEVLDDVERGNTASRNYHLAVAAKLSLSAGLPEAALEFDNVRIAAARTPRTRVEALQRRAETHLLLGDTRAAAADIEGAAEAAAQLDDAALRERNVADVNVARAALYSVSDLHRAVSAADAAVDYVRRADPAFTLGKLLMLRGMSRKALGDAAGAEADLVAAIEAFETKRRELISAADRLRAFDYERPAFKQLVRFHSLTGAHAAALRIAERSRTGGWARSSGASAGWLDPIEAHRSLPAEVALVYFETLDDRVLVWVLTRERFVHFSRALDLSTLTRQVARIERAIHRGATLAGLEPLSRELVTQLIAPALAEAGSRSTIVFIPDGPLYSVPFAALPIAGGGPLLAQRTIGVAPSFTIFVQASKRLEALAPDDVLAVGAGHDPRATGLAALPFANGEARAVGDLYPQRTVLTGADATVSRVLAADRAVVHFAGHTVVNREFPLYSRLFLAPASDDPGVLLASRILDHPFNRTRVVVLATCEAGAGTVIKGEGIVSVARAFVAAGVPSVVASLWPVNDDQELFTTFHRELRQRRDAATALREAQLAAFRQGGGVGQVRSWGGLAALGGIAISSR